MPAQPVSPNIRANPALSVAIFDDFIFVFLCEQVLVGTARVFNLVLAGLLERNTIWHGASFGPKFSHIIVSHDLLA